MRKVIEWCEHHRNDPIQTQDDESDARKKTTDIEEWDQKFMQVDQEMLFEIILVRFPLPLPLPYSLPLRQTTNNGTTRPPTTSTSSRCSTLVARLSPT